MAAACSGVKRIPFVLVQGGWSREEVQYDLGRKYLTMRYGGFVDDRATEEPVELK